MSEAPDRRAPGVLVPPRTRLPELRIAPSAALLLHEECDPDRVVRLTARLTADGVLRNPPIVATVDDGAYVVLDGANRVTAMQGAGLSYQLVQVVNYDDPALTLDVWAHLLADDGRLIDALVARPSWDVVEPEALQAELDAGTLACGIVADDGARGLTAAGGLAERVAALKDVVAAYKGKTQIYRVRPAPLDALAREYGQAAALILFPRLSKAEIRTIARLAVKLPTGISRHVVPLRALRVNVPLDLLRAAEPLAAKQARLDDLVRTRLLDHRVRHYPESTVLYDE